MALDKSVTEIADSDEELVMSSPGVGSSDVADKLHAMASAVPQEPPQDASCTYQALTQADANTVPLSTVSLDLARNGASVDTDASGADHTDVKPQDAMLPQEEGAALQMNACPQSVRDSSGTCQLQAPLGQMVIVEDDVMRDNPSQPRSNDVDQNAIQSADMIYPNESAVHISQTMGTSDTTRISAAATSSPNPTTPGTTASALAVPKDSSDTHLHPGLSEIQGGKPQINTSDCRPSIPCQESVVNAQESIPFTPQIQPSQEKPQAPSSALQQASQPKDPESHDLNASDAPCSSTCESQDQPTTGASPTAAVLRSPSRIPQETTLSELKAHKAALLTSLRSLPAIQVLLEEMASSEGDADGRYDEPTDAHIMTAANKVVKEHIKLLHEYNELKDVGQGLMGLIADQRGVRIVEVQEEFGIDAED
ncbi:Swi5-domain-containing protein [Bipolaris maydis]|nr:Swi5-domain-containing protein [Bipolaris maydis]KAJ6198473.1 Swi5-domain-containing protein [Bipolaris maydis]KAJ6210615.1 Swi5-domain-containing protein [Bipolaris maydis]